MMTGKIRAPERFCSYEARSLAEFEHMLGSMLGADRFDGCKDGDGVYTRVERLPLGPIEIVFATTTGYCRCVIPSSDVIRVQFGLAGGVEERIGKAQLRIAKGAACVTPAYTAFEERIDDHERIIIHYHEPELRRKLSALLGSEIDAPLRFEASDRIECPDLRMLRMFAGSLLLDANMDVPPLSPLVQAELGQTWMAALLLGTGHNYSDALIAEPADAGLYQVQHAVDYIEANWNKPLLIEDLTAAIGVSARSLFRTFRRFKDTSPKAYLRMVRLRKANQMLVAAGRETSVADVASTCGFNNAGHFAKDYRVTFGEAPSATLARTRTLKRGFGRKRNADELHRRPGFCRGRE
jgi:AraC-like DNA-binding protein